MLSKAQGLGKKTAERIVVELKDKVLPKGTTLEATPASSLEAPQNASEKLNDLGPYQDALSALLTLGYKATEADQAVRKAADALGQGASTEKLIRKALGR